MIKCIQPQDWFAAIDLKDAYFHVSILPRHRPFLQFAFEGRAWQFRVLPFRLSLSPCVFTKVVEGALTPLREVGVRILNYVDDWLILAQFIEQLGDYRDLVLRHLSQFGLRVNWEKSKLSPVQRISFLGVESDSVSMTARLTEERAQAVLNYLSSFRGRNVVPLKQFQRLLGHMASTAAVTPLGLLQGSLLFVTYTIIQGIISSEMLGSLHLTHPKRIRTWSSGQPLYGARGAVRGSVPCSRALQSQFLPARDLNLQTSGYRPDSLTIRPRLPLQ